MRLVKVGRRLTRLMKATQFTHVVLNERPLSLTFVPAERSDRDLSYELTLPRSVTDPGFQLEADPPQALGEASVVLNCARGQALHRAESGVGSRAARST